MKLFGLVVGLLLFTTQAFAQTPSCEDQLALSNQLLQDFNQDRGQLQVQNASLKVQLAKMQKAAEEMKAKAESTESKKK